MTLYSSDGLLLGQHHNRSTSQPSTVWSTYNQRIRLSSKCALYMLLSCTLFAVLESVALWVAGQAVVHPFQQPGVLAAPFAPNTIRGTFGAITFDSELAGITTAGQPSL